MPLERRLNIIVRDRDSIVEILMLEDGVPRDSSGALRCDVTFKRPGQEDVTFSSSASLSSYWFQFQYPVVVNGIETFVIRCNFRDLPSPPINGRWTCYVHIWDTVEEGRFWGTFEVEIRGVPGVVLTSQPYPIESLDEMAVSAATRRGFFHPTTIEEMDLGARVLEGFLDEVLVGYSNYVIESLDVAGTIVLGSLGDVTFIEYENYEPEELDLAGVILDGELESVLQSYSIPVESLNLAGTIRSGTLETL